ncbi:TPA: SAM-dependent methyltransferase, partial [Aeromonas dhakensis]|nr:SAM-dependent methyltransferase [Aeromonas dhakensis]
AFPHPSGQPASSDGTPEAAPPLAEDRLSRLDEEGLRRHIAPLPLQLQQCWESEETDGRWLHALLLRS